MGRFRKILNKVRKNSFTEVKGIIMTLKVPFSIPGAAVFYIFPRLKLMVFTNKCNNLQEESLEGMIAHELSHFSRFDKKGYWYYWKYFFFIYGKEAKKEERETDKLAIRKGYGKQMAKTKLDAERILKGTKWEKYLDNYLSSKEVKKYIQEIKIKT
jgi:hypothetical protein